MSEDVADLLWVAALVLLIVVFASAFVWLSSNARDQNVACLRRGGMYLDQVCVRGEVIDLTKP